MEKKYVKPEIRVLRMDAIVMAAASIDTPKPHWAVDSEMQGWKVEDAKQFDPKVQEGYRAFDQSSWGDND